MHSLTRRLLVGLGGTGVALIATASPAFAGTISQPTPSSTGTYTLPVDGTGNPLPFDVSATGFGGTTANPSQVTVYIEICDGVAPSTPNYDPNVHCDAGTSPAGILATSASNTETWSASDSNFAIGDFRGQSPSRQFNCLAPEDVKPGTAANADGSVTPIGSKTANGDSIRTSVPSWTNCQLRISSSNENVTADQVFETLSLPNTATTTPPSSTPEVPLAVVLPLGAAALFAAGYGINRRRNRRQPVA